MVALYKPKPPQIAAVYVIEPRTQANEIAEMVGAVTFSVDVSSSKATFMLDEKKSVSVEAGQYVAKEGSNVVVYSKKDFEELYVPYV